VEQWWAWSWRQRHISVSGISCAVEPNDGAVHDRQWGAVESGDHEHGSDASLKIWIDADAAPRDVKELVFRAAKRLAIDAVLVANQRLQPPPGNPQVSAVWVDGGPDIADQYIASHAVAGDLVVTQDVPLAALLVPRQVAVLDPRGEEHTTETIGERLSVRDFMEQARMGGLVTGGPPPYDARAKQAFAAALDRVLTRLRRSG
jgi:uncharacterized protein YaiI (UPF0178 family)